LVGEEPNGGCVHPPSQGDEYYATPRALFRVFKWLVNQPGWQPPAGISEVEWVLEKQGGCETDKARAVLEELLIDLCNTEVHGTRNYKLKFYNARESEI
jgi:hypothetical protein